jgi:hypothetical protein
MPQLPSKKGSPVSAKKPSGKSPSSTPSKVPSKKAAPSRAVEDEEDESYTKASTFGNKQTSGWAEIARRKALAEEEEKERENRVPKFIINDGETAGVQFLSDEPYCFDSHEMRVRPNGGGKAYFDTFPCQLVNKRVCVLCDANVKTSFKAAFKVLDHRGSWDKDKKKFKYDAPVEKLWIVSKKLAFQIEQQFQRRGSLVNFVFDISRSGARTDTTYNIEIAVDEKGNRVKPVKHKEKYMTAEESCQPQDSAAYVKYLQRQVDAED